MKKLLIAGAVACFFATLSASASQLRPDIRVDHDDQNIPKPAVWNSSELFAILYNSISRNLNVEYQVSLAHDPGALNANAWDEVPDSTWFTNRIGKGPLTFQEIVNDLGGTPPRTDRQWKIRSNSNDGYTPKFSIEEDGTGNRYFLKFDLPTAVERNSAAERICTLILHAAGFNVPRNTIVYFNRNTLYANDQSTFTDTLGMSRRLTDEDLKSAFEQLKPAAGGQYRGLASERLPDNVGVFFYSGRRKDDANDIIPHEMRRELRGLRVIASWINHVDVGDKNAFDQYVMKNGGGYVKHYLLDFGSTMGSGDFVNGPWRVGNEFLFDWSAIGHSFVTLGLWRRPWEINPKIPYPEIGYFQSELFEPEKWKPNYPNLAFERADDSDGYWGAKIVTAFSANLIDQIVAEGKYSRADAASYIAGVLKKRQDAIGRYWFNRVAPLEAIALDNGGSNQRLVFKDLGVERKFSSAASRTYRYWIEDMKGKRLSKPEDSLGLVQEVSIRDLTSQVSKAKGVTDKRGRTPLVRVLIQTKEGFGKWALPVEVFIGRDKGKSELSVLGWNHAPR